MYLAIKVFFSDLNVLIAAANGERTQKLATCAKSQMGTLSMVLVHPAMQKGIGHHDNQKKESCHPESL
ncbi:hypothetical protein ACUXCC_005251 [Cytobacillus horneckiae]|uniref:hypothetical protein n=1 Tax=Cytobacillus horneckiae TaxID=549687 RepID=UPI0019D30F38|nr:hypothetical protein [Cytobacillus horneckiae]MBN6889816.1 hypothetical protein [Cytobacillus horneckiae]